MDCLHRERSGNIHSFVYLCFMFVICSSDFTFALVECGPSLMKLHECPANRRTSCMRFVTNWSISLITYLVQQLSQDKLFLRPNVDCHDSNIEMLGFIICSWQMFFVEGRGQMWNVPTNRCHGNKSGLINSRNVRRARLPIDTPIYRKISHENYCWTINTW